MESSSLLRAGPSESMPETAETVDETYDAMAEEMPAHFAPRLAAYAAAPSRSPSQEYDANGLEEEEERDELAAVAPPHRQATPHGEAANEEEGGDTHVAAAAAVVVVDAADDGADDELLDDDAVDEDGDNSDSADTDFPYAEANDESTEDADGSARAAVRSADVEEGEDLSTAFPVSRVKDILRFEGNSSIIAGDACLAASEAVALILRDMVRTAATEAQRRGRKTVTYDDIAKTVTLLDRFSFLSDVVPPVASAAKASTTGKNSLTVSSSAVLGESRGAAERTTASIRTSSATARAKAHRLPVASPLPTAASTHPGLPGADGKRQTTLRF